MPGNTTIRYHEVVDLFPRVRGRERQEMLASIKTFGVKEPVKWVDHPRLGKVLIDGANRRELAAEAGLECPEEEYRVPDGLGDSRPPTDAEVLDYVMLRNKDRRQLNSSQLAAIAIRAGILQRRYEARARRGMRTSPRVKVAAGNGSVHAAADIAAPEPAAEELQGDQATKAANQAGTNRAYLFRAAKIGEADPELLRQVSMGELSLESATKVLRDRDEEAAPATPAGDGPTDALGLPVPKRLRGVFKDARLFEEARQAARHLKGLLRRIKASPAAAFWCDGEAEDALMHLQAGLRDAAPHAAACPYCAGSGKVAAAGRGGRRESCAVCRGGGWCSLLIWRAAPEELKAFPPETSPEEAPPAPRPKRRRAAVGE